MSNSSPKAPAQIRALIADDDPIFGQIGSAALRSFGYLPAVVADGATALEALVAGNFDVALVDLSMPRIDGFRLIALIRSTPRIARLPIVVLTVHTDQEAIDEAYRLGAQGYMTKPINWRLLDAKLRELTAGRTVAAPPPGMPRSAAVG